MIKPLIKDTTLITVDGVNPELALKALVYSMRGLRFEGVKLLSFRKPEGFELYEKDIQFVQIPKLSLDGYNWFKLKELGNYIDTEWCLSIEPDGFIINPELWDDQFFDYDYIGAPWLKEGFGMLPFLTHENQVGNSGFSLRSKRLIERCKDIPDFEQNQTPKEDVLICRKYRHLFEDMHFAPVDVALRFSFEFESEDWERKDSFGFHCFYDSKNILAEIDLDKPKHQLPEELQISYTDGIHIKNNSDKPYSIEIKASKNNRYDVADLKFVQLLEPEKIISVPLRYYKRWETHIKQGGKTVYENKLDLRDKNVLIVLITAAIGDTIAWFPYVERFRKQHGCNVYCVTYHNYLFEEHYPDINFIEPKAGHNRLNKHITARYFISMNEVWESVEFPTESGIPIKQGVLSPKNPRLISLQQVASDILGLPPIELKPKIKIPNGSRPIEEKYITIGEFSNHGTAKMWNNPHGWQELVDWLNSKGYKVAAISKEHTKLKGVLDWTGDKSIAERINQINHSEFFIGISSGLSWLAWATGKQVVMISGFTDIFNEFQNIRVINTDVCHGCWHRNDINFAKHKDACPEQGGTAREFECTKTITSQMVIDKIKKHKLTI
jgi:autotransporter strand-loop-strand O-heptosyltransferase